MSQTEPPLTIGWVEYVDFPDWDIRGIKCKTDTGARTSALHVENLVELPHHRLEFDVVTTRKRPFRTRHISTISARKSRVRSSNGHYETRHFIYTRIRIGPWEKIIELSLVSRSDMVFRMLLGRKALTHHLLVDPSHRNLLSPRRRAKRPRSST